MSNLTNGRYNVPITLVYIDEPEPRIVRVRHSNRPSPPMRFVRRLRDWR